MLYEPTCEICGSHIEDDRCEVCEHTGDNGDWVEEVINDYLNNLEEAQKLGLTKPFLDDATARGFGAGVDTTGKLPVRKIGEAIIDADPTVGAYRKAFTENPIVEARAKLKRGRPKGKKNKPKP